MLLGSLARASTLAAAATALAACGGTVEFGVDRGDSGFVAPPPSDTGVTTPHPDATVVMQPDAGACTPRMRPAIPATWPYPMSAAAYLNNFANVIPAGAIPCSNGACHGGIQTPYIPDTAALATPANATRAINELWLRARPPVGGGVSTLRLKHASDGGNVVPQYTPQQVAAIDMFLERAYNCAWKLAGPPGAGECPAPDTSYCDL